MAISRDCPACHNPIYVNVISMKRHNQSSYSRYYNKRDLSHGSQLFMLPFCLGSMFEGRTDIVLVLSGSSSGRSRGRSRERN